MSTITALFVDITELLARFTVWDAIGVLTLWLIAVTVALTVLINELRKILREIVAGVNHDAEDDGAAIARAQAAPTWNPKPPLVKDAAWRARRDAYFESIDPPPLDHTLRKMRKQ